MPKLQEHPSALCVDGIDHFLPAGDLLIGINTGCTKVASTGNCYRGCLGDNQTSFRSALTIILDHQRPWDIARLLGPLSGEGCHDHAMGEVDRAELHG